MKKDQTTTYINHVKPNQKQRDELAIDLEEAFSQNRIRSHQHRKLDLVQEVAASLAGNGPSRSDAEAQVFTLKQA